VKLSWALFTCDVRPGSHPFQAVHLVDAENPSALRCTSASDGETWFHSPTQQPIPFMTVCTACLAIAEWEINK
jgi:hypothetical protein